MYDKPPSGLHYESSPRKVPSMVERTKNFHITVCMFMLKRRYIISLQFYLTLCLVDYISYSKRDMGESYIS